MKEISPELLMAEADRLFAYARQRVGDHQQAEDLVQACLVTAWEKRGNFDGRSQLSTWLTGIMKYKILDYFRACKRDPDKHSVSAPDETWEDDPLDQLFDAHGSWKVDPNFSLGFLNDLPSDQAHWKEILGWVQHCTDRLPDRLKMVFLLREVDELSVGEVAQAAGVTVGSAGVLLTRARHKIRTCLQSNNIAP
ncbi:MAG: sigma-70 family RNA polymerase sigma factor [Verrucomicrobiales bacterium]|nr:sigma-70 family RNA polymerase sigma factor [Verrucomicrobiales bacterium]